MKFKTVRERGRLAALLVATIVLASCINPFDSGRRTSNATGSDASGSVTVTVATLTSSTIIPDIAATVAEYTIELTRSGHDTIDQTVTSDSPSATFEAVAVGTWTVSVQALDSDGIVIGTGSKTVDVGTAGSQNVAVSVGPTADGTGSFSLEITWPSGEGLTVSSAVIQDPDGTDPVSLTGQPQTDGATLSESSFPSGQYVLAVELTRGGTPVATILEAIHVYNNFATTGTIQLQANEIAQPPAAPTGLGATETPTGSGSVELSWTDESNVETTYKVWRSTDGGSTWPETVDLESANLTSYTDTGLAPDTTYTFRLTVHNDFGFAEAQTNVTTGEVPTVYVSASGGDDSTFGRSAGTAVESLGRALDLLASDGTIKMAGGTYSETVTVSSGVTIEGGYSGDFVSRDTDANRTIIEQSGVKQVVLVEGATGFTLDGIDVRNTSDTSGLSDNIALYVRGSSGTVTGSWVWASLYNSFSGVVVTADSDVTVDSSVISNISRIPGNSYDSSTVNNRTRGIYLGYRDSDYGDPSGDESSLTVSNSEIYGLAEGLADVTDHNYHYGFFTTTYQDLVVENNTIDIGALLESNTYPIGVYVDGEVSGASATITGNTIVSSDTDANPTGIWIRSDTVPVVVERNFIEIQGSSSYGRGIQLQNVTDVLVANNVIVRTSGGGSFWAVDLLNAGTPRIYNNTIAEEADSGGSPTLIRILTESSPDIRNNIFANLGSTTGGKAIADDADAGFGISHLQNNLFHGPGGWSYVDQYTTATDLNDPSLVTDGTAGSAADNVTVDPAFSGAGSGAEAYKLTASSPDDARNGGQDLSSDGVTTDHFGTSRTVPVSIGAHEYDTATP